MPEKSTTQSGVYCIKCTVPGRSFGMPYVGSSVKIAKRWSGHRRDLDLGKHCNRHLQNAWNRYGADAFEWSVLELVPSDGLSTEEFMVLLIAREQHYIDELDAVQSGFNSALKAGSTLGVQHSAEAIANISEGARRRSENPVWQANHAEFNHRNWQDPVFRAKQAAGARRSNQDPVWRAKMTEVNRERGHRERLRRFLAQIAQGRLPAWLCA